MGSLYISNQEELKLLNECRLFKGLGEKDIPKGLLCLGACKKSLRADSCIFSSGDTLPKAYVLLKGKVELSLFDTEGRKNIVDFYDRGKCFCSFYRHAPDGFVNYHAYSKTACDLVCINMSEFLQGKNDGCRYRLQIGTNFLQIIAERSEFLLIKHDVLSQKSLRQKLLTYLGYLSRQKNTRQLTLSFNKTELAQFLSADRSALSREIQLLIKEGHIQVRKKTYTLLA